MKIRHAIGCIILYESQYILVKKINNSDIHLKLTNPEWDFVKGGIRPQESLEEAVYRELFEETGSKNYKIICEIPEKLYFNFSQKLPCPYDAQETTFFLVQYNGNITELHGDLTEIAEVKAYSPEKVFSHLKYTESKTFFHNFLEKYSYLTQ